MICDAYSAHRNEMVEKSHVAFLHINYYLILITEYIQINTHTYVRSNYMFILMETS